MIREARYNVSTEDVEMGWAISIDPYGEPVETMVRLSCLAIAHAWVGFLAGFRAARNLLLETYAAYTGAGLRGIVVIEVRYGRTVVPVIAKPGCSTPSLSVETAEDQLLVRVEGCGISYMCSITPAKAASARWTRS
ncbi:hypothetical protein [Hyperthermus butylicus]|uniref:Uncharacterized protein n=1 Tax=Hyperthermus butylicus (strain DSM 5456 / JCM 9403 / PLM1-5) TaxID=415426 RepID=A2BL54_HYPBU|nr:hypothetical protein [Hyperthermus butylicus]ABM80715.1 hypothetical protein Hbut_0864 [Hyperthermus butylicus DSM 5456]